MDESIQKVRQYYDAAPQLEWERLERHPFEFLLTTYMMERYVRPGDSVLDIGGGPGRYSLHFAQKGCDVTLVDLSRGNVDLALEKAAAEGVPLTAFVENCLELERLNLGQFDHVFLMGPLYHLTRQEDHVRAVKLALRHLKPGGKLYVSFILAFAGILYDLQHGGHLVADCQNPDAARLIEALPRGEDYCGPGFTSVYFYHQNNILPFMSQFGLKRLHFFGQEGILAPNYVDILTRDQAEIDQWVALSKRLLELPELLSYSEHAMYIGEKYRKKEEVFMELHPVDKKNIWKLVHLSVSEDQRDFVASNTESILEAYTTITDGGVALPFGIYDGDTPVGFVMLGYGVNYPDDPPEAEGNYCLWRFMIDQNYQRRGYGSKAMELVLDYVKTYPCGPAQLCWLSYEPENEVAKALYHRFGFRETGEWCGDEVVAVLPL